SGSTDLRDTLVQQPKVTATLSWVSSWRPFSANSGQFEAGSTTTGASCLPSTPPLALISSMVISAMSLSEVSEMAMVPDSECRIPTLMVSAACRVNGNRPLSIRALAARVDFSRGRRFIVNGSLAVRAQLWVGPWGPGALSQHPCQFCGSLLDRGFAAVFAHAPRQDGGLGWCENGAMDLRWGVVLRARGAADRRS